MISYWFKKTKIVIVNYVRDFFGALKDIFSALFLSTSHNYIRVESLKEHKDGRIDFVFSGSIGSYRAFKKFQRRFRAFSFGTGTIVSLIVVSFMSGWFSSTIHPYSNAATFGWIQTDWSGELDSGETISHEAEKLLAEEAKWDKYVSQTNLDATSTPGQIKLSGNMDNWTFNTTNTLNTWATSSEVQVLGTELSLLKQDGDVCANATVCDGTECTDDWETGIDYCHNQSTKCIYNNSGTLEHYDDGYELCNANTWYKTCSSGTWGAEQANPQTVNEYCTAQGDDHGGYYLAYTCSSGATGGFSDPGCADCANGYRANVTMDGCISDCSDTDSNCIQPDADTYYCYSGDGSCNNGSYDEMCDDGAECDTGFDCSSALNQCKKAVGETCASPDECVHGFCQDSSCILPPCGALTSVDYAGENYPLVNIGNQCWFAKNLNIGTFRSGGSSINGIIDKNCLNHVESNCDTYGGLYSNTEAMYEDTNGTQGICPAGWHIPTHDDLSNLLSFLGSSSGSKLAGDEAEWPNGALDADPNFGSSGLDLLPGEWIDGCYGSYWFNTSSGLQSSSPAPSDYYWLSLHAGSVNASLTYDSSTYRNYRHVPVRCIMD